MAIHASLNRMMSTMINPGEMFDDPDPGLVVPRSHCYILSLDISLSLQNILDGSIQHRMFTIPESVIYIYIYIGWVSRTGAAAGSWGVAAPGMEADREGPYSWWLEMEQHDHLSFFLIEKETLMWYVWIDIYVFSCEKQQGFNITDQAN